MNFEYFYSLTHSLIVSYPLLAVGVGIVLALLLWKKPGVFMKISIGILLLVGALYIGSILGDIGGGGFQNKYKMSTETESKM